ncbi:MAG: YcjX family protein [Zavarzinella sp.]
MAASPNLRWKTLERRIGLIGPQWSGKTVLLTSLINHLQFHEPQRFRLGKGKSVVELSQFQAITTEKERELGYNLPWFDYAGYRNRLITGKRWPAKTHAASQYAFSFSRSDWRFSKGLVRLFDLPGERISDLGMMAHAEVGEAYSHWSRTTLEYIRGDMHLRPHFHEFLTALENQQSDIKTIVQSYKHGMVRARYTFHHFLTPSTLLLDPHGKVVRGLTEEQIVNERHVGIDAEHEFSPLPENHPHLGAFRENFRLYREQLLAPIFQSLKTCHSLVILVDVLSILGHGPAMYNGVRTMIDTVLQAVNPKQGVLDTAWQNLSEWLLPKELRRSSVRRIAFVVPKVDRVPMDDRVKLKGLLERLVGHHVRNLREQGIQVEVMQIAAMIGATQVAEGQRTMKGCLLYDPSGKPLEPGVPQTFSPSEVPHDWPHDGWQPGDYVYPDVYPRVSPLANVPTEQAGLNDLFQFVCW